MHTLLIDRANWSWEVGLSERTYWDCDNVLAAFNSIVNGRAASRAEMKRNSCTGISDAHECRRRPFDLCALPGKAGRSEEHTSELQSLTNLVCCLLLAKKKKFR